MTFTLTIVLLIFAIACFLACALRTKMDRIDLWSLGWFFAFCALLSTLVR
jgi:hypothetical protein